MKNISQLHQALYISAIGVFLTLLNTSVGFAKESSDQLHEIKIAADKTNLKFDITEFTVAAGASVRLVFINPEGSLQPHNILFVKPGAAVRVGMLVNRKMSDSEFLKNPNPGTSDVLVASTLLQAGEKQVIDFTAPQVPGDYPYLCTYPGHWAVMKGVMKVRALSADRSNLADEKVKPKG